MAERILVVGGGGREHALVRTLLRSPQRPRVACAPGNAGIVRDGVEVLAAGAEDVPALVEAARGWEADFVVVGPEVPLVAGLVDRLSEAGIAAFGPSAAAARIEGSKTYAKDLMRDWLVDHYPDKLNHVFTLLQEARGGKDYDANWSTRQSGVGPYAWMLGRRFETTCERLGLNKRNLRLRTDLFKVPPKETGQLSLF